MNLQEFNKQLSRSIKNPIAIKSIMKVLMKANKHLGENHKNPNKAKRLGAYAWQINDTNYFLVWHLFEPGSLYIIDTKNLDNDRSYYRSDFDRNAEGHIIDSVIRSFNEYFESVCRAPKMEKEVNPAQYMLDDACIAGDMAAVKKAIKAGANPLYMHERAINLAWEHGNIELANWLSKNTKGAEERYK